MNKVEVDLNLTLDEKLLLAYRTLNVLREGAQLATQLNLSSYKGICVIFVEQFAKFRGVRKASEITNLNTNYSFAMEQIFPEFKNYSPPEHEKTLKWYWWDLNYEGYRKRKDVLNRIIFDLERMVRHRVTEAFKRAKESDWMGGLNWTKPELKDYPLRWMGGKKGTAGFRPEIKQEPSTPSEPRAVFKYGHAQSVDLGDLVRIRTDNKYFGRLGVVNVINLTSLLISVDIVGDEYGKPERIDIPSADLSRVDAIYVDSIPVYERIKPKKPILNERLVNSLRGINREKE